MGDIVLFYLFYKKNTPRIISYILTIIYNILKYEKSFEF